MSLEQQKHAIEPMPRPVRVIAVILLAPVLYVAGYLLLLGALSGLGYSPFGAPHPLTPFALLIGQSIAITILTASLAVAAFFEKSSLSAYSAVGILVGALSLIFLSDLPIYAQAFWIAPLQHGLIGFGTGFAVLRVIPYLDR